MRKTLRRTAYLLAAVAFLALTLPVEAAFARAGGGGSYRGGGRSSGGSRSGGGSFGGSRGSGGSGGVGSFAVAGLVFGGFAVYSVATKNRRRNRKAGGGGVAVLPTRPEVDLSDLMARDPNFDADAFCRRTVESARRINEAWCTGDMAPARADISDAVYVRYQTQLHMQEQDGQRSAMDDFVASAAIIGFETDDLWDTIDVRLDASAKDITVPADASAEDVAKRLERASASSYTEVWSFIRRRGTTTTTPTINAHGTHNCPSCGAPIDKGEVVRCGSCKKIANSGVHDWVLAEITQAGEYVEEMRRPTEVDLTPVKQHDPAVSRQAIEDRASMLFFKWVDAKVTESRESFNRFSVDDDNPPTEADRLRDVAVGAVRLERVGTDGERSISWVEVEWSAKENGGSYWHHIDELVLVRSIHARSPEGLYPLGCPVCGGPIPDTDAKSCKYCKSPIERTPDEWVLAQVNERVREPG